MTARFWLGWKIIQFSRLLGMLGIVIGMPKTEERSARAMLQQELERRRTAERKGI